ncbi:MAG: TraR/DksA C4-type zinc finger protein [Chloroflexi bacterium]|nr:TraR/DksA C4-type zinc finger protein [Chloroflexota bacterium]
MPKPSQPAIDVEKFRTLLVEERKRLLKTLSRSLSPEGGADEPPDLQNNLSDYPDHPADLSTELFEREKEQTLKRNARELLERVEDALRKIENGTYGICSNCDKPIPERRLEVLPSAVYCVPCQSILES